MSENNHENQENKRPQSSAFKKSGSPNKWDAVMSKIEENKNLIKKNFNNVKSKVSCGVTALARRDSPSLLKSPPSECGSIGGRSVASNCSSAVKRSTPISAKR